MDNIDQEIAEFHRAARRRKAIIFGVAAVLTTVTGAAALLIGLLAPYADPVRHVIVYDARIIVVGAVLVIAGLGSAWKAFQIGTGRRLDAD